MMTSDGVVFASPNYSYQVTAVMKAFLDRLGFVFHRPRFFGKSFTSIVAQGIYGGSKIVEYLDFVGMGLGFNVVKGSCVTALEPMSEQEQRKIDSILAGHSRRFHDRLSQPPYPVPTLVNLWIFRNSRTSISLLDETYRDYTYYRDKGWFESDYYYPTRLNMFKKAAGRLFDYTMSRSAKNQPRV
jgi:NADPH-dependent FMN reductase